MYYALLNEDNIVQQVIVCDEENIALREGNWVETDMNGISPKNYAGVGHTYDAELNAFICPSPYPSWILNEDACWESPVPLPSDDNRYRWDEESTSWIQL